MDTFDVLKGVWDGATWLWDNWGSPTMVEDAGKTSPMLGAVAEGLTAADAKATEFGGWAAEFFPSALEQVQATLEAMGMGWMSEGLRVLATPLLLPMQLGADFATWFTSGGQQTLTQWASAAWEYIKPISEVFASVALALGCPPLIPMIFAGWAWRLLPDCIKPPIVDLLLDVVLSALVAMPEIPGLNGLFSLIKPGLIGVLSEFRQRTDEEKIIITDKVAKILSGSPEFVAGFAIGLGKGLLDGILDPLMLIWLAIKGVVWLVDTAATLTADVRSAATDASQTATAAADTAAAAASTAATTAADLANTAVTLGPVDLEALAQTAAAAGDAAATTVAPGVDPLTDPNVVAYLQRMGEEIRPPAEVIGETFMPAFTEAFGGEGGTSISSLAEMVGSLWETMQQLIGEAGQWIGQKICELMLSDSAEYDIGHGAGYVAGMVVFEVLLAVLTAGTWVALGPTARAVVKFLDLGGEMLGAAFRALGQLGELLMSAVRPIMDWLGNSGLMATLKEAFGTLAEKLIALGQDLGRMLGFGDEAATAAARKADDVGGGAATRMADGQVDDGLAAVRRSVMAGDDVKLAVAAQRIRPEPGMYDVVVHADGDRLLMLDGGAWRELSPADLAQRMRADGYDGGSVRLIACGSGQADGAAAKLSRELGADVKAPNDTAWIHPDGTITVGPRPDTPSGGWSRTSSDGASELVEDSARLSDDALEQADDAVAAGFGAVDDAALKAAGLSGRQRKAVRNLTALPDGHLSHEEAALLQRVMKAADDGVAPDPADLERLNLMGKHLDLKGVREHGMDRTHGLDRDPLTDDSVVIDTNVRIGKDVRDAHRADPTQPKPTDGDERAADVYDDLSGGDMRVPDVAAVELGASTSGLKSFPITVDRASPEYQDLLNVLQRYSVGAPKGAADREIVADTFFAVTSGSAPPVLRTMDGKVMNGLLRSNGIDPAKITQSLKLEYPTGFDVTINGQTIKVIPV